MVCSTYIGTVVEVVAGGVVVVVELVGVVGTVVEVVCGAVAVLIGVVGTVVEDVCGAVVAVTQGWSR